MALSIKNREAKQLARRLAALTGETLTDAVTVALRERLSRVETPAVSVEELLAIGRDCARRLKAPYAKIDHGDALYDERGLPR
ncbi:MAG: type II toxin-antitoxin system VapB family antitoxin [Rhodospirillales bacterium]|nr:MAG: type II toxin-antitoxin system VapB family antitoxin [Rhodospirillales bacterium]